jgi:dTDP-4-dehydrorhamnose reductase
MKVLLIGGSGQLGTQIRRLWDADEIVAPAHAELDIADVTALEQWLVREAPDLFVNCAAFHNVDQCELQPERAFAINSLAVDRAAALCAGRDVAYLTISTDYVFDGETSRPYTEWDCPRPISAYGASKLAGEHLVLRREARAFVVRTCGVYGTSPSRSKGHTFIDRLIAQAQNGDPIRVVNDVTASPTYAGHLAIALREIVAGTEYGLYHACNSGPVTWYDFARAALDLAGHGATEIEAIPAAQWKAGARRPAFSALENARLGERGMTLPDWRAGIDAYLLDKEYEHGTTHR